MKGANESSMEINPPVIIIGMHRSGTTMIAELLSRFGLFIGWELESYNEAVFFSNRNNKILSACNGGWDNPGMMEPLLCSKEMRNLVSERLKKDTHSPRIISYLGLKRYIKNISLSQLNFPWGWKDPKNTILLPLWLDVFADAKIIYIYRNGVDVAQSLSIREKNRLRYLVQDKNSISKRISVHSKLLDQTGMTNYLMLQMRKLLEKIMPLSKYSGYCVHPCVSIERAFDLWNYYNRKAFEYTQNIDTARIHHMKYEDFLSQPQHFLESLSDFCGINAKISTIDEIVQFVDESRKYAFKKDKVLCDFYEKIKDNYWMEKLGYSKII